MPKLLLILLLAFLMLVEPGQVAAESASVALAETALLLSPPKVPRPVYKRYKGNSRSKKKRLGVFRRWAAYRKAKRKNKGVPTRKAAPAKRGVIKVDAPDMKMPAPPPAPKP